MIATFIAGTSVCFGGGVGWALARGGQYAMKDGDHIELTIKFNILLPLCLGWGISARLSRDRGGVYTDASDQNRWPVLAGQGVAWSLESTPGTTIGGWRACC